MKKLIILVLSLSLFTLFLTACEDPAANKTKATTTNSTSSNNSATNNTNTATTNAPQQQGTKLPLTPENSKIEFTGSKVTGKHDGGFKGFSGYIELVNNKPEQSKVAVEIDMNSVFTDSDDLTAHLKTADFFDVGKFPNAYFTSKTIVADAAKGADNYTVTGDFDLHGQKKSISFPAKITVGDADVAVDAEFSINRKDFGIVYAGKTDDLIRDDVVIRFNLKSPKK